MTLLLAFILQTHQIKQKKKIKEPTTEPPIVPPFGELPAVYIQLELLELSQTYLYEVKSEEL